MPASLCRRVGPTAAAAAAAAAATATAHRVRAESVAGSVTGTPGLPVTRLTRRPPHRDPASRSPDPNSVLFPAPGAGSLRRAGQPRRPLTIMTQRGHRGRAIMISDHPSRRRAYVEASAAAARADGSSSVTVSVRYHAESCIPSPHGPAAVPSGAVQETSSALPRPQA